MPVSSDLKVLCVDDQGSMLALLRHAFAQLGIRNVREATSGTDALLLMNDVRFDLVTLDWNMPGINGLDLFKMVRGKEWGKNLPIIMVTGNSDEAHVRAAVAAGVRLFLRKPITVKDLKLRVEAAVGKLS